MNALGNKIKRGAYNILYAILAAAVLTGIGWCLTMAILNTGGLTLCLFMVAFLVVVEIYNMVDVTNTKKASENDLSLITLFFNASLLAHFACAIILLRYLENMGAITPDFLHITGTLNEVFSGDTNPDFVLKLLLMLPIVRLGAHLWYVIRLAASKRYFWV
ncbi:MAG: hypothetical protein J6Y91_06855 [Alphaproteobacteria bacterium]|nr:hypothetical protein [Alphaproteobacteria bacterium]